MFDEDKKSQKTKFPDDPTKEPDDDFPYSSDPLPFFNKEEQQSADTLVEWKNAVTYPANNIIEELQNKFGDNLPNLDTEKMTEMPIATLIGHNDNHENIDGPVEIYYENGDYYWGDLTHGVKAGVGVTVLSNGDYYVGSYKEGDLDGFVTEFVQSGEAGNTVRREVFYKNGVRHGFYREIGPSRQFLGVGRFVNGRRAGSHWGWRRGDSFLVGPVDEENKPHGENIYYLYPDMKTVLCGDFSHGILSYGKIVRLSGVRVECGIPVPIVRESDDTTTYIYDPSSESCISETPMVRDPYEKRYVYVKESGVALAGEGLWAKTGVMAGQVCALFNGVRQHRAGTSCRAGWSDYRISCGEDLDLDIEEGSVSPLSYRATLAHKTCHSFQPNSHFAQYWHPRFGSIMSIVADKDIIVGEEIFVSYSYVMAKAPEWYQELWFQSGAWRNWSG